MGRKDKRFFLKAHKGWVKRNFHAESYPALPVFRQILFYI